MQIPRPKKSPPSLKGSFVSAGQPGPSSGDLRIARWLGCLTAVVGGVILTGWIAGWPLLKSLFPGQVEAKANTAMAFVLAGLTLAVKSSQDRFKGRSLAMLANFC